MNVFVQNTKEDILKKVCNPAVLASISLRLRRHGPLAKRLMHISGSTSGVSMSSSDWLNYAEFPGDVCVVFFNVPPWKQRCCDALAKEERRRVYKCDAERLSESTKRWISKSM